MAQLICRYRKGDRLRWISHLDLKRTLERAMRRAQLPLALSEGHNPHPRVSFGPPLPLGATGDAEVLAFYLSEAIDPGEVKDRLNQQLPSGLEIVEAWLPPRYKKKETFGDIDVAEYQVGIRGDVRLTDVSPRVSELLAQEELVVERGGQRPQRTVDIRPLIFSLAAEDAAEGGIQLRMRLRTGSHGGARPQEVVALLGLEDGDTTICYHRTGLYASAQPSAAPRKGALHRWTRTRSNKERREER